jgi:hypothetical protein
MEPQVLPARRRAAGASLSGWTFRKSAAQGQGSRTQPVVLLEPVLVPMTSEAEQRAVEALAELLAPLFSQEPVRRVEPED